MDIGQLKVDLRVLSKSDLQQIKKECEYLLSKTPPIELTDFARDFYELLIRNNRITSISFPPLTRLSNNKKLYNAYITDITIIQNWIITNFQKSSTKTFDLIYLYKLLIDMLIKNLQGYFEVLTIEIIIYSIHKIPAIFESQFPDYISNNYQYMIFNSTK